MNKLAYYCEMAGKITSFKLLPKAANYLKYKMIKPKARVSCYTPQIAALQSTNQCNLRCGYCRLTRDGIFDEKKQEMTIEMVQKIFSHPLLKNAVLVDILGGEPLLCNDFINIVAFLSSRGYLTNFSTNGLLLANKVMDLKKAKITRINVSIYPENINLLRKNLKDINGIFPVHVSYVLTKSQLEQNPEEILQIVEMTKRSGCKSLRFWMFRPLGKNPDFNEVVTNELYAYKIFSSEIKNKFKDYVLLPSMTSVSERQIREKKCRQLWQRINISAKGEIAPCCGGFPALSEVNIFSSTLDEIYNHPAVIKIRENLLDKTIPALEVCQSCNLLNEKGW